MRSNELNDDDRKAYSRAATAAAKQMKRDRRQESTRNRILNEKLEKVLETAARQNGDDASALDSMAKTFKDELLRSNGTEFAYTRIGWDIVFLSRSVEHKKRLTETSPWYSFWATHRPTLFYRAGRGKVTESDWWILEIGSRINKLEEQTFTMMHKPSSECFERVDPRVRSFCDELRSRFGVKEVPREEYDRVHRLKRDNALKIIENLAYVQKRPLVSQSSYGALELYNLDQITARIESWTPSDDLLSRPNSKFQAVPRREERAAVVRGRL